MQEFISSKIYAYLLLPCVSIVPSILLTIILGYFALPTWVMAGRTSAYLYYRHAVSEIKKNNANVLSAWPVKLIHSFIVGIITAAFFVLLANLTQRIPYHPINIIMALLSSTISFFLGSALARLNIGLGLIIPVIIMTLLLISFIIFFNR